MGGGEVSSTAEALQAIVSSNIQMDKRLEPQQMNMLSSLTGLSDCKRDENGENSTFSSPESVRSFDSKIAKQPGGEDDYKKIKRSGSSNYIPDQININACDRQLQLSKTSSMNMEKNQFSPTDNLQLERCNNQYFIPGLNRGEEGLVTGKGGEQRVDAVDIAEGLVDGDQLTELTRMLLQREESKRRSERRRTVRKRQLPY